MQYMDVCDIRMPTSRPQKGPKAASRFPFSLSIQHGRPRLRLIVDHCSEWFPLLLAKHHTPRNRAIGCCPSIRFRFMALRSCERKARIPLPPCVLVCFASPPAKPTSVTLFMYIGNPHFPVIRLNFVADPSGFVDCRIACKQIGHSLGLFFLFFNFRSSSRVPDQRRAISMPIPASVTTLASLAPFPTMCRFNRVFNLPSLQPR